MKTTYSYISGDIYISGNIDSLREMVEDITSKLKDGEELPGYITDLFFSIELDYQTIHNLGDDDYTYHPELNDQSN